MVYTAMTSHITTFREILSIVDGVTLTLHEKKDVSNYARLCLTLTGPELEGKSMRLNIFEGIDPVAVPDYWQTKTMTWTKDCPVPSNEDFMRFKRPTCRYCGAELAGDPAKCPCDNILI